MGRRAVLRWTAAALLVLLASLFVAVEWHASYQVLVDQERMDADEVKQRLAQWEKESSKVEPLREDDIVEVFYAEHLLASWILQASPWNAFHSGLVVQAKDATTKAVKTEYTFEFTPTFTDTVAYVLHPLIDPVFPEWMPHWAGVLYARATTSYNLTWQNHGGTRYRVGIPTKFTNFTHVGTITGKQFNGFLAWVKEYDQTHKTFEPVEIVLNGSKVGGHGSSMCHDLFYYSLNALTELGFAPQPKDHIFRDHIMVFAESYERVDADDPAVRKDIVRYYRMFMTFMELINQEFTNIRNLLVSADAVEVVPYLYLGGEYYRVKLVPPYVNYCYLAVAMPPNRSSVWDSEHLCALEQTVVPPRAENWAEWLRRVLNSRNLLYITEQVVDDARVWTVLLATFLATLIL